MWQVQKREGCAVTLHTGDCLDVLIGLDDDSIDTIITDPPYGIGFMSCRWDYDLPDAEVWRQCLRVAKPGAFLVCASSPRTQHRIACDIEDAGWLIRDCIIWLYGQGNPKGLNIGKSNRQDEWRGYNTSLKPAYEPFLLAMKPLDAGFVRNAELHGVAGLNIDGCRIASEEYVINAFDEGAKPFGNGAGCEYATRKHRGRYPSNVILSHSEECVLVGQQVVSDNGRPNCEGKIYDGGNSIAYSAIGARALQKSVGKNSIVDVYDCAPGCPVAELNKQSGFLHGPGNKRPTPKNVPSVVYGVNETLGRRGGEYIQVYDSGGGASRFFYKAKVSTRERLDGLKSFFWRVDDDTDVGFVRTSQDEYNLLPDNKRYQGNCHRTVKPVELMRYLVKLTRPPSGGVVLDPFMGSGTTGVACVYERRDFIGVDLSPVYAEIARARIEHAKRQGVQLELL